MASHQTALRFYGVVDADESSNAANHPLVGENGIMFVRFRDLASVVAPTEYVRVHPGDDELADYVQVVDALAARGPIAPAPPGTVFRDEGVLRHWMEIHYAKLHEALGVIEERSSTNAPYDFVRMELEG